MPRIEFALSAHTVVVLLAALAATGLALLYYRTTLPRLTLSQRVPLALLRAASLCILVLLIFQPLLRLVLSSSDSPVLAVLVDDSRSMRIVDRTGDRATMLRSLLTGEPLRALNRRVAVRYFTFGLRPGPAEALPSDTLALNEDATDIAAAIRELQTQKQRQNICAALLITDGAYTIGQNPVYDAERLGLPLYTVGIGDSAEQNDLSVQRVAANDLVYSGVRTPVDILVKSSGYGGERVELALTEGTRELDRTTLVLRAGTQEYAVRLTYEPSDEGMTRLGVRVSTLPGEVSVANNRQTFMVRVLKSRLHILLLSGVPSPDVAILRQTFAEQTTLSVRAFTQNKDGGFYEGLLSTAVEDSADCLVLVDMPTAATTPSTLERIKQLVETRNLPVFFVAGKNVDITRLTVVSSALPFTMSAGPGAEDYTTIRPEEAQRGNPVLELGGDSGFDVWKRLPPIFRRPRGYRAKPEATVLATCVVQNVPTREPLLLTRSVGRQKSLAITGYGLWRWRLMAQGENSTEHHLDAFLYASIRWLTTPDDTRRFKVVPSTESFSRGEPAEFSGQLYDASAQPVDDARIHLVVRTGNQVAETNLRSLGNGRYEGALDGLGEGEYTYSARADWRGGSLGEENGKFSVGGVDLEFRDVRMNVELLRQLAYRTGGSYLPPGELARLDSLLRTQPSFTSREVSSATELELWHWKYVLMILVLLFAAEWLLRKWQGML